MRKMISRSGVRPGFIHTSELPSIPGRVEHRSGHSAAVTGRNLLDQVFMLLVEDDITAGLLLLFCVEATPLLCRASLFCGDVWLKKPPKRLHLCKRSIQPALENARSLRPTVSDNLSPWSEDHAELNQGVLQEHYRHCAEVDAAMCRRLARPLAAAPLPALWPLQRQGRQCTCADKVIG